jgi:uncharacterized protein
MNVPEDVVRVLRESKVIAVLGAHYETQRPAYYVPEYLCEQGYRVLPVNTVLAGKTVLGSTVRATLTEITEPVDVVDVFRRAEALPSHLDEILSMNPLPKVVWFQQGIRNDSVAKTLESRGIKVIQDRCMLADHQQILSSTTTTAGNYLRQLLTLPW